MPSGENMGIKELATELEIVYSYTETDLPLLIFNSKQECTGRITIHSVTWTTFELKEKMHGLLEIEQQSKVL